MPLNSDGTVLVFHLRDGRVLFHAELYVLNVALNRVHDHGAAALSRELQLPMRAGGVAQSIGTRIRTNLYIRTRITVTVDTCTPVLHDSCCFY